MGNSSDVRSRPYLEDPYALDFEARITSSTSLPDGYTGVVLDRTYFYPTSGGQPHDTGTLDGEPVLEVVEDEAGQVVHRLSRAPRGEVVRGRVDGARRRDHMQQHSGQHLLSATCVALLGRETLSFHLGAERCSIDLPGDALAPEDLVRVERRANEIDWEGREVRARIVPASDLADMRKAPPTGVEAVRVVEIEGWDTNACCGTHVRRTNEIGLVKLLGQERLGRGTRLHFACGGRALAECDRAQRRVDEMVRALTCHPDELAEKCAALLAAGKSAHKELVALRVELAGLRARTWVAEAPRAAGVPLVVREVEAAEPAMLGPAAEAVVAAGGIALLGMQAGRAHLLCMRPPGVELDLRPALQAATALVDGKGGGRPDRVQGSGPRAARLADALAAARHEVLRQLVPGPESF